MTALKKILFVCTGNTCRSAMAEGICRKIMQERGIDAVVDSAGMAPLPGVPANPKAIQVMEEIGIDISGHRSKGLTGRMLRERDLVYGMTNMHVLTMQRITPEAACVIFPIMESEDIPDPYGRPIEVYRECRDQIYRAISALVDRGEAFEYDPESSSTK
jgi:protein-tyrosine-phosphatase